MIDDVLGMINLDINYLIKIPVFKKYYEDNQISKCVKALKDWLKMNKSNIKKITHSTKPLEDLGGFLGWKQIKILTQDQVEEAIYGFNMKTKRLL